MVSSKRINLYIEGIDKIIPGGIPAGNTVLIAGITGCMKSSLTSYVLYKNANAGKKTVFISLEHSEKELRKQMENFGWHPDNVEGNFYILDKKKIETGIIKPYMKGFYEELIDNLLLMKQSYNYELVALDCLTALDILANFKKPRVNFFRFFEWLKKLDTTSFVVSEMSMDSKSYSRFGEEYIVDGIFHLAMVSIGDVKIQRRIRCVKMRNAYHNTNWFTLDYTDNKFYVLETIT